MSISLIDIVFDVYSKNAQKTLHVDEITREVLRLYPDTYHEFEETKKKVSGCLARNVQAKSARFKRVKGKKGSNKRGFYTVKPIRTQSISIQEHKSETPKQQTGRGGEFAVISELLFLGHNATLLPVDTGIDVISSKDDNYYHIQVKTRIWDGKADSLSFTIKTSSFERNRKSNDYYIFVIRRVIANRWTNDYIILHSSQIQSQFIKTPKNKQSFSVKFRFMNKDILIGNENITYTLNNFKLIK